MYEPNALDRFLAFHAPRITGFDPKKQGRAVPIFLGMFVVVLLAAVTAVLHSPFALLTSLFLGAAAFFGLRSLSKPSPVQKSFLLNLYHQVYGQYGWNEDAGPHRSTEPVPIRSADKVLKMEAFDMLDSAAVQALRIYGQLGTSPLAESAKPAVDRTMLQLFEAAQSVQQGGVVPASARQALDQLRELADQVSGMHNPLPAMTGTGLTDLESALFDARAESKARMELESLNALPQQQQQQQ